MEYHSIVDAKAATGMRLVLTKGVPGPWGEAAKAIFKFKEIEFMAIGQDVGAENKEQVAWLGIRNAPVAIYETEKPRSGWAEILSLAERVGKGPSLIPEDSFERALMMGLSFELAGESGLGWVRRLMMLDGPIKEGPSSESYAFAKFFGDNYGYSAVAGDLAEGRAVQILELLGAQLKKQQAVGRKYLVGDSVSALDIYWAAFAALVFPLPDDVCPMSEGFRAMYEGSPPKVKSAVSSDLLSHRDLIYEEIIGLPKEF